MNTELERTSQPVPQRPDWKRRILIAIPLLVLTGMVWWVMWGAAAAVPDELVTAKRGPDGKFHQASDSVGVKGHLSTLKSSTSATTVSSASSGSGTVLRTGSALVSVAGQNLFAQRVAHTLFQELKNSNHFRTLNYLPPGETLPEGKRLPELFITVGVNSLDESGVIPYRSLKSEISVHMSDRYRRSSHSHQGTYTPPGLQFRWQSNIDYSAREIGIETASARYEAVGRDVAGGLAKSINEHLDKLAEEHGVAGNTPLEYLPEFVSAPDIPFLKKLGAERILSGPAFMKKNITIWKIPSISAETDILERIANGLREASWDVSEKNDSTRRHYMRVKRNDSTIFEAFPISDGFQIGPDETVPQDWYCVYEQRMTGDEGAAALRAILKRDVPESTLVQFWRWWYLERDLIEAYFREHPPQLPESLRFLIRERIDAGNLQAARELLLRADALYRIREPAARPSHELQRLAEEAGFKKFPELPDLTALQDGDFVDLREQPSVTLRLAMGESVILLLAADDHEQRYYCMTPIHHPVGAYTLHCEPVTLSTSGANWGNQTQRISAGKPNEFQLSKSDGGPAFDARVTLLPDGEVIEFMVEPHEG